MQQGRVSSLRAGLREDAGLARPMHCLEACAAFLRGSGANAADSVVDAVHKHLGAAEVLWLRYRSGVLEGVAASGSIGGSGTRYAVRPGLQPFLVFPCRAMLRDRPGTGWLVHALDPGYEWLVPLVRAGQVTGLLGVAGQVGQGLPMPADQRMMELLAVLLAEAPGMSDMVPGPSDAANRDLGRLTPREREVLSLLPRGYSNARIADCLGVAPGTVKTHIERVLGKLQLEDRAQAAARAVELGLGHSGLDV